VRWVPAEATLDETRQDLIASADLIVFPIGSFFTSVMSNLLVRGVGRAVAGCRCPKVYIPNASSDPEMRGHTIADCVGLLLAQLRRDAGEDTPTADLLNFVLVDARNVEYTHGLDREAVEAYGVQLLDVDLAAADAPGAVAASVVSTQTRGAEAHEHSGGNDTGCAAVSSRQKQRRLDSDKVCRVLATLGG
jgi:2-phospho-L-lactate transferase/gluconeogenesis factor (CofD/UPF0052 family)